MKMTDSSSTGDSSGNSSGSKRPADRLSTPGVSASKLVKFNGNTSQDTPVKKSTPSHYTRDEIQAQRQALPVYLVRKKYVNIMLVSCFFFTFCLS